MIDLRSDTVTRPTPEMLHAMAEAETGDDVFGEDPTANTFEQKIAEMFGQEAGLFVPSGTMSNQLCVRVLAGPGDEIILDEKAHIFNYETGAAAALSGVQLRTVSGKNGMLSVEDAASAIRTKNDWDPITKVIALENTTNKGGGAWYKLDQIKALRSLADQHGLSLHLDGARIWNALEASGYSAEEVGKHFDTISVCFSKGLGSPVGSMMLGSRDQIIKARRFRKMFGGGMRQIGLLAAATDYAVENHRAFLKNDHAHALEIAGALERCDAFSINPEDVFTNIILFDTLEIDAVQVADAFREKGVAVSVFGPKTIRMVTHFQVSAAQIKQVVKLIDEWD